MLKKPDYYTDRGPEVVDIIGLWFGDSPLQYWEGNIIKYLRRYRYKHNTWEKKIEDLKKAKVYLEQMIARLEECDGS